MTAPMTRLLAASALALLATGALAQPQLAAGQTLAPADQQTFSYNVIDEFPTLDPGLIEDVDSSDVARQLFEGLLTQDAQGEPVPGVATGYTVSDDGLTYTFTLRPEAKWSDGTPVTAEDFAYSWRRAADPATASPYSWYIELMNVKGAGPVVAGEAAPDTLGVRAVDPQTFEVTLERPTPYFPQMVTHTTTLPVPRQAIEAYGDQWTQPGNIVVNGAYTLSERVPQERTVLTRNPSYWDDANTTIDTVTAFIINDDQQALTRWEAGELDRSTTPIGQFPRLKEQYGDEALALPNLCTYYYHVNLRPDANPALLDPRVREALSLAIDRDIITQNITAGGQIPAYTLTHPATAGWTVPDVPAAAMTQAERNARAQELMTQAGFGTNGEPLSLGILFNTSPAHEQIAVAIGQMWKQTLGIDTTLSNTEWQTFLDDRKNGNFEIARAGWCADYNEPSSFLDIMTQDSDANDSRYANADYDALLQQSRTSQDPNVEYAQAEAMLARDLPILPIYFYTSNYMLDDTIGGWPVENAQQNWYAKELYRIAAQ